jgi:hypothetical protein
MSAIAASSLKETKSPEPEGSLQSEPERLELAADQVIASCGGDMRSAIRVLILANDYLEYEIEQILARVSKGFLRGHGRKPKEGTSGG